ncbi:hypothetical protein D3C71_1600940 [compost metagenome]
MENCVSRSASSLAARRAMSACAAASRCSRLCCWRRCQNTIAMLLSASTNNSRQRFCQKPGDSVSRGYLGCSHWLCSVSRSFAGIARSALSMMPASSGLSRRVATRSSCGKPMSPTTTSPANSGSTDKRPNCASSTTA